MALCIQHAVRMRHIANCGLSSSTIFFHINSKMHDFRKKKIWHTTFAPELASPARMLKNIPHILQYMYIYIHIYNVYIYVYIYIYMYIYIYIYIYNAFCSRYSARNALAQLNYEDSSLRVCLIATESVFL